MPKTLIMMRHGKTRQSGYDRDWDRELKHRGITQSKHVGAYLKDAGLIPDRIISSSAVRARTTAEICAAEMGYAGPVEVLNELYAVSGGDLVGFVSRLDNEYRSVLVVGHNPAFEEAVSLLSGQSTAMGTGDCALLRYDVDSWAELAERPDPEDIEIIRPD